MGLATSQVRLLALTSRKADVEMQIQLNSKRKTMLTREATELAKLYYAKLQNTKIQYSTANGYKDVNYGYLMAQDTGAFFDGIVSPGSTEIDRKTQDGMILTDNYGRVILSDAMMNIVINTLNDAGQNAAQGQNRTVETMTLDAMKHLLGSVADAKTSGVSSTVADVKSAFMSLYDGTAFSPNKGQDVWQMGLDALKYLYENGVQNGGVVYKNPDDGAYYSSYKCNASDKVTLTPGVFYIAKDAKTMALFTENDGSMYWPGAGVGKGEDFISTFGATIGKQMCQMFSYYGAIFSAAFNGNQNGKEVGTNVDYPISNLNVAATVYYDPNADNGNGKYTTFDNSKYEQVSNSEQLQDGLKSGIYQLVNVSSNVTGGYAKAQGLDYFKTQNYVIEKADTSQRETITAWYNAARADLSEKESYWDTEITALSSELNTITTEIDSVKKLREDAISSTFKWGSA